MSKLRQGDIYIFDTFDGGEISIVNGELEMDGGFESAIYLSMFGQDRGRDGSLTYWADPFMTESQKPGGLFYSYISGFAKTTATLLRARQLLLQDLQWIIDDWIADIINVELISTSVNAIEVNVEILKNNETLFENVYQVNWGFQENDPANRRI